MLDLSFKGRFAPDAILYIEHQHMEACNRAVCLDPGDIAYFGRAVLARTMRHGGIGHHPFARHCPLDQRQAGHIGLFANDVPDMATNHFRRRLAHPILVEAVGEAIDMVRIDIGNQDRQRIRDGAQFGLALGQGALRFDLFGILDDGAHHPTDLAVLIIDRRVEEIENHFFRRAVAIEHHGLIKMRNDLATKAGRQNLPIEFPDFRPDSWYGPTHRLRVIIACNGDIAVIVDHDMLGSPHEDLWHRRVQHIVDRSAQLRRPARGSAKLR